MKKIFEKAIAAAVASSVVLTACTSGGDNSDSDDAADTNTSAAAVGSAENAGGDVTTLAVEREPIKAIYAEIRTEYNNSLDLSDYPLTKNGAAADFSLTLEAEDAVLEGSCKAQGGEGYSGDAFVTLGQGNDRIKFSVDIENAGLYDLNFVSHAGDSGRENFVHIDGVNSGSIVCNSNGALVDSFVSNIYLGEGTHEIAVVPSWGYTDFDCLKITPSTVVDDNTYKITEQLSNPNADEHTKSLYKFLCDIYGKYSLTGQFADEGRLSSELKQINKATGKDFAVLGLDMMDYSSANQAHGASGNSVEFAYDWYVNAGGIVQMCWHWNSPEEYAIDGEDTPWYQSFYEQNSNIDLDKIMNGEDDRGYQLLMADIDNIANQLERLRDEGVPVIWRPLHEAAGGWFWWGDCSPESFKKLWTVMYDKMTNEHNLTNLIWMWNGQDADWYPGDDCVDIIAWDIYQGNHVYTSFSGTFAKAVQCSPKGKLVALSENGCVMDPDNVMRDNARWLFWGTWAEPFTISKGMLNEEYTEKDMLIKAYNHDRTLTLDELPDLKEYK